MILIVFLLAMSAAPAVSEMPPPAVLVAEGPPDQLRCAGTEPFWSISLDGGGAVFETPERHGPSAPRLAVEGSISAQGRPGVWAFRMRSQEGQESIAVVRQAACSDGMSDLEYPYTVALLQGEGELLDGCCK